MPGDDDGDLPVLPYPSHDGPTSGYSGSETSEARAREADSSGETSRRQKAVLAYLAIRGVYGATWRDVSAVLTIHHGSASGVLSNLHKAGRITRLKEARQRCKVYVLNEHVGGRDTEPYGKAPDFVQQALDRDVLAYLLSRSEYGDVRATNLVARIETRHGEE